MAYKHVFTAHLNELINNGQNVCETFQISGTHSE